MPLNRKTIEETSENAAQWYALLRSKARMEAKVNHKAGMVSACEAILINGEGPSIVHTIVNRLRAKEIRIVSGPQMDTDIMLMMDAIVRPLEIAVGREITAEDLDLIREIVEDLIRRILVEDPAPGKKTAKSPRPQSRKEHSWRQALDPDNLSTSDEDGGDAFDSRDFRIPE